MALTCTVVHGPQMHCQYLADLDVVGTDCVHAHVLEDGLCIYVPGGPFTLGPMGGAHRLDTCDLLGVCWRDLVELRGLPG